jgi:hypothetical protein
MHINSADLASHVVVMDLPPFPARDDALTTTHRGNFQCVYKYPTLIPRHKNMFYYLMYPVRLAGEVFKVESHRENECFGIFGCFQSSSNGRLILSFPLSPATVFSESQEGRNMKLSHTTYYLQLCSLADDQRGVRLWGATTGGKKAFNPGL